MAVGVCSVSLPCGAVRLVCDYGTFWHCFMTALESVYLREMTISQTDVQGE